MVWLSLCDVPLSPDSCSFCPPTHPFIDPFIHPSIHLASLAHPLAECTPLVEFLGSMLLDDLSKTNQCANAAACDAWMIFFGTRLSIYLTCGAPLAFNCRELRVPLVDGGSTDALLLAVHEAMPMLVSAPPLGGNLTTTARMLASHHHPKEKIRHATSYYL